MLVSDLFRRVQKHRKKVEEKVYVSKLIHPGSLRLFSAPKSLKKRFTTLCFYQVESFVFGWHTTPLVYTHWLPVAVLHRPVNKQIDVQLKFPDVI